MINMLFFSFLWNFTNRFVAKKSIAPPSANTGLTYNGSTQTGVNTGTGYSLSNNTGIDASSYTATATLSDTTNTQWSDGTTSAKNISWSISAKSVAVEWETTTFTYNGKSQGPTASATGVSGETLTLTSTTQINAGSHTSTATLSKVTGGQGKTANYTLTSETKKFTINAKSIAVEWGTNTTFTYNGSEQKPSATVDSGVSGETIELKVTGGTNVASYTATASISKVTGGQARIANYTLTNTSKSFSITKANGYVNLDPSSGEVIEGTESTSFIISSYHGGALTVSSSMGSASLSGTTVTVSGLASLSIGTTVTVNVYSAATNNYNAASNSYTITIIKQPDKIKPYFSVSVSARYNTPSAPNQPITTPIEVTFVLGDPSIIGNPGSGLKAGTYNIKFGIGINGRPTWQDHEGQFDIEEDGKAQVTGRYVTFRCTFVRACFRRSNPYVRCVGCRRKCFAIWNNCF